MFEKYSRIIIFDLETTGVNFEKDEIIEFGGLVLDRHSDGKFKPTAELNYLIKSSEPLQPIIKKITGITDEMLEKDGISRTQFEKIAKRLFNDSPETTLLIAFNIQFDANFISIICPITHDMLDVMAIHKDRNGYCRTLGDNNKPLGHRLDSAVRYYNVTIKNTHRAIDDTKATFQVLLKMIKEKNNVELYINRFGYNPKYKINGIQFPQIQYIPQGIHERNAILNRIK